jgi:hypothetical protein
MFYELEHPDEVFTFGDVVKGLVCASSVIDSPNVGAIDYKIDVIQSGYFVIMTPCCSIGEQSLLLSPLRRVNSSWFNNPYFAEDLTHINTQMTMQQALPPEGWRKLTYREQQERSEAGPIYRYLEYFIYAPNERILGYFDEKTGRNIGHYMIDFRRIHRAGCKEVQGGTQVPINAKVLQLSVETRGNLKDKLCYYFSRTPDEDLCRA